MVLTVSRGETVLTILHYYYSSYCAADAVKLKTSNKYRSDSNANEKYTLRTQELRMNAQTTLFMHSTFSIYYSLLVNHHKH